MTLGVKNYIKGIQTFCSFNLKKNVPEKNLNFDFMYWNDEEHY